MRHGVPPPCFPGKKLESTGKTPVAEQSNGKKDLHVDRCMPHFTPVRLSYASTPNPPSRSSIDTFSMPPVSDVKMADRQAGPGPDPRRPGGVAPIGFVLLQWIHDPSPNSAQVVGLLTFLISGGVLLLLTGLTLTATVLGLILFTPLIILSSPIWIPAGAVLFFACAGFLAMCAVGVTLLAGGSWFYKYVRGRHPPGSDRVDYARSRIADTASHVKDYARGYGGYLQSRVKDAAPGA